MRRITRAKRETWQTTRPGNKFHHAEITQQVDFGNCYVRVYSVRASSIDNTTQYSTMNVKVNCFLVWTRRWAFLVSQVSQSMAFGEFLPAKWRSELLIVLSLSLSLCSLLLTKRLSCSTVLTSSVHKVNFTHSSVDQTSGDQIEAFSFHSNSSAPLSRRFSLVPSRRCFPIESAGRFETRNANSACRRVSNVQFLAKGKLE